MSGSVFRSHAAQERVRAHIRIREEALGAAVESVEVRTRTARTRVLVAGRSGPPVVFLHGANGGAIDFAALWHDWGSELRCFFVDVPGEPNLSEPVRLDGQTAGVWFVDLLDGLEVDQVRLFGMSGGGWLAQTVAAAAPERVERLALLVPDGLVAGGTVELVWRVVLPMLWYRATRSEAALRRFATAFVGPGQAVDEGFVAGLRLALDSMKEPGPRNPLIEDDALARLTMPTWVLGAGADRLFPGKALVARAERAIPGVLKGGHSEVLPDAGHVDPRFFTGPTADQMRAWLAAGKPCA